ncbi:MAG: acyl-(acyl carrier protein)-like protein [Bacteroidetes bacterium]|nr:MAG: acyl-(acyl carrier protein)-like protein [Bacteroidota bacterium]
MPDVPVKTKKAIIFGTSGQAEVMDYLITHDSAYEVVAFTSTRDFIDRDTIYGRPLIAFEDIEKQYPPSEYDMHVAIGYNGQNKTRERFYNEAKAKGYRLLTYISSRCTNYAKSIGDNCFIFEDNTIQPFVEIGNNCILWSGNHIGHHSKVEEHVFISSHVVISGHCRIGHHAFLGVNSTLRDGIKIAPFTTLGAGCLIVKDTEEGQVYIGTKASVYSKKD